ncbi:MAG: hypothetical protein NXY57DRAFT_1071847 [Lentinula lateritia]|nr:MAG: hypothetical protein NXY57DRAFT_1071847 [Lentinula lateritia]
MRDDETANDHIFEGRIGSEAVAELHPNLPKRERMSTFILSTDFGFPTGVGALVTREGLPRQLKRGRSWSAGGTADVAQVPGKVRTMEVVGEEFVEGRTINYLLLPLPAITSGLHLLSAYLPFLPLRLNCLLRYLVAELSRI